MSEYGKPIEPYGMSQEWWHEHRLQMQWLAKVRMDCMVNGGVFPSPMPIVEAARELVIDIATKPVKLITTDAYWRLVEALREYDENDPLRDKRDADANT